MPTLFKFLSSSIKRAYFRIRQKWFMEVNWQACPACEKYIIGLRRYLSGSIQSLLDSFMVYPKTISRVPISTDVIGGFANDYKEACLVFTDSPKASAALSRRCLQNILRGKA